MREFEQYFECYRCSYIFDLKTDMQRHLSKKYPCYWSGKNKEESDEEVVKKKAYKNIIEKKKIFGKNIKRYKNQIKN